MMGVKRATAADIAWHHDSAAIMRQDIDRGGIGPCEDRPHDAASEESYSPLLRPRSWRLFTQALADHGGWQVREQQLGVRQPSGQSAQELTFPCHPSQATSLIEPKQVDQEVEVFEVGEQSGIQEVLLFSLPPRESFGSLGLLASSLQESAELDACRTSGLARPTAQA